MSNDMPYSEAQPYLLDAKMRELQGVEDWLERLDRDWDLYPPKWREGMYKHYLRRFERLSQEVEEIRAHYEG